MPTVRPLLAALLVAASTAAAQQPKANVANWTLSNMFADTATMRRVTYSTSVTPNWINGGDSLWYSWRDHVGCNFLVAYPKTKAKTAMFDQSKLASQLSTLHKKPFDPTRLPFNAVTFAKDAKSATFNVEGQRYEWTFATQELKSLGRAIDSTATPAVGGGRGGRGAATPAAQRIQYCGEGGGGGAVAAGGGGGGGERQGGAGANYRNYSPDSSMFVFGRAHNVYLVTVAKNDTVQLSKDGEAKHSFVGGGGFGGQQQDTTQQDQNTQNQTDTARANNNPVRVAAEWSPDSKAFYIRRTDTRKVHEICYINSLTGKFARPEPICQTYGMPGDEDVPQQEVWIWRAGEKQLVAAPLAKWRDQQYFGDGVPAGGVGGVVVVVAAERSVGTRRASFVSPGATACSVTSSTSSTTSTPEA